jgi:hypothetical protein
VIDVDPLPRDSSADIWFVLMVGGNNFDPRARYLADVMRRPLLGEHRTGASNVSVIWHWSDDLGWMLTAITAFLITLAVLRMICHEPS